MANIDIYNLENSGSELFDDSENFLADLDEQEDVVGGFFDRTVGQSVNTAVISGVNDTFFNRGSIVITNRNF